MTVLAARYGNNDRDRKRLRSLYLNLTKQSKIEIIKKDLADSAFPASLGSWLNWVVTWEEL